MKKPWITYWRNDSFWTTNGSILKYDKVEHAILGFVGMFVTLWVIPDKSIQLTILIFVVWNIIGILWEIGQLIFQKFPIEVKDLAANNVGLVLAGCLNYLLF